MTTTTHNLVIENSKYLERDVLDLIDNSNIGEPFQYDDKYRFVARQDGKLVGIIAYDLVSMGGKEYPKIEHIIFHPDFQRKRTSLKFLKETEKLLRLEGYTQFIAFINNNKELMIRLAMKFGYAPYHELDDGKYYYKNMED